MSYFEPRPAESPIAAETRQCLVSKRAPGVGTRARLHADDLIAIRPGGAIWRITLISRAERFRQTEEQAAPRPVLRCADADAGSVADLVDLVEHVDHVEARGERAGAGDREHVGEPRVDLGVIRQMRTVRYARAAVGRGYPGGSG